MVHLRTTYTRALSRTIARITTSNPIQSYLLYNMTFKRKRSDSGTSPSTSSTATFPSRDPSSSPCPDISMLDDASFSAQPIHRPEILPSHLNSRTRKRFRDNRPNESEIHGTYLLQCTRYASAPFHPPLLTGFSLATTYERLFLAARSPPPTEHSTPSQNVNNRPSPPQRQSSLHNFWLISSSTPAVSEPIMAQAPVNVTCEDCEALLPTQDSDICMGGVDGGAADAADYACRSCSRNVCGTCAIVEVGAGRECLQCRMSSRKKWVGGIGWML